MKKTFKFLTLTVLLSMVGVLSAFAQNTSSLVDFTIAYTGELVRYKVLSINWDATANSGKSTGTVSVTNNSQSRTVENLDIPGTFKQTLSGYYNGSYHSDEITFTVTTIEARAFQNLTITGDLVIPGTVTTIMDGAFSDITSITELTIGSEENPSDLTTLGDFVFGNMPLTTLDLRNCPKLDLGNGTKPFVNIYGQENHRLQTVYLPDEIENIGVAFANMTSLTNLDLSNTHVNVLDPGALANTGLTSVTLPGIPDKTTANVQIGKGAFAGSPIETLTIGGPIAAIGAIDPEAFIGMEKLKKLQIDGDLKTANAIPCYYKDGVAKGAFPDSPLLEEVIINGAVSADGAIADNAFKGKTKLKTILFDKDVAAGGIGESAFEGAGTDAEALTVTFNGKLTGDDAIGEKAFKGTTTLTTLTFGDDLYPGAIGANAFEGTGSCATVTFSGQLIGAESIGQQAFMKSSIQTLTFAKDIAAGGIGEQAFREMTACGTAVSFGGKLAGEDAIDDEAFIGSKITSLTFEKNINAGGIGNKAFKDITACTKAWFKGDIALAGIQGGTEDAPEDGAFCNATITSLVFDGDIAAGGIDDYAFNKLNGNTAIEFNGKLDGTDAIGEYAFNEGKVASVKFTKDINYDAVDDYAFFKLNTRSGSQAGTVEFAGNLNGENAIGNFAFSEAVLSKIDFKSITGEEAVGFKSFYKAGQLVGGAGNCEVTITGNVTGEEGIDESAFEDANLKSLVITGNVEATNAINENAFKNAKMQTLKIKGDIKGTPAIAAGAFEANPLTTINLAWDENVTKTISATADNFGGNARQAAPITPISNSSDPDWCNDDANESAAEYQGPSLDDPYPSAIMPTAFKDVVATGETTLNIGSLKSSLAIAPGAFAGAEIEIVNFNELMAPWAIAPKQFAANERHEIAAATLKTVNFLKEFKVWEELDANNANLIGVKAFTGTKVETVNFPKVSVKRAIVAPSADASPFAGNGADLTLNFEGDVCTSGFGMYAFSNSNVVAINLKNSATFEKLAFEQYAFLNIDPVTPDPKAKFDVVIKYDNPADNVNLFRAFHIQDFYSSETAVDIQFVTIPEVVALYTVENNATDKTPYRIKFISRKYIKMMPADGYYFGFWEPQDEKYVIEKYQPMGPDAEGDDAPSGATAGVYSAYYDDKTLAAVEGETFLASFGGGQKYTADLYLNPLRVQDKGKYVLNEGHTFIVTSSSPDPVVAYQCVDDRDGGVQTFANLTPWQCNDLRWNPDKVWARYGCCGTVFNPFFTYDSEGKSRFNYDSATGKYSIAEKDADGNYTGNYYLTPGHEWGGEISWVGVENGDIDYYGNIVRDYSVFVAMATDNGVAFSNAPMIPADYAYVLVTDDRDKRIDYSGNNIYPVNEGDAWEALINKLNQIIDDNDDYVAPEYRGDYEDWMKRVIDIINKVGEKNGYMFRVEGVDPDEEATHVSDVAHRDALLAAFRELFGQIPVYKEPVYAKDETTGEDLVDPVTGEKVPATDDNGDPVTKWVFNYETEDGDLLQLNSLNKEVCRLKSALAVAEDDLAEADVIDCIDMNSRQFIEYLKQDENIIAAAHAAEKTLDEYIEEIILPQLNGQKFSVVLAGLETQKETYTELKEALEEILEKKADEALNSETGDDLYKQYLEVKNGETIDGSADLAAELTAESEAASNISVAYQAAGVAAEDLKDEHAIKVWDLLTFDRADYSFESQWAKGFVATQKNDDGDAVVTVEGLVAGEVSYTAVVVKTNEPTLGSEVDPDLAQEYVGQVFYVKALNGAFDSDEYYELYRYNGDATHPTLESELIPTGLYATIAEGDEANLFDFTTYEKDPYELFGNYQYGYFKAPVTVKDEEEKDVTFTTFELGYSNFGLNQDDQYGSYVYYFEGLASDITEDGYYKLYGYTGAAEQPTQISELTDELYDETWYVKFEGVADGTFDNVILYTEKDVPYTELCEGTVQYEAPVTVESEKVPGDVDFTPITVLTNDNDEGNEVEGFVGKTYYVKATAKDFEADEEAGTPAPESLTLMLYTCDDATAAQTEEDFTATGIEVTIKKADFITWVTNWSAAKDEPETLNCLTDFEKEQLNKRILTAIALSQALSTPAVEAKPDNIPAIEGKDEVVVNPKDAYSWDNANAARLAAKEAALKAANPAFGWYTQAVNANEVSDELKRTYNMVKNQILYTEILRQIEAMEAAYKSLACYGSETTEGTYAYYLAKVGSESEPAVEAVDPVYAEVNGEIYVDPTTGEPVILVPGTPGKEAVAGTGLKGQLEAAKKALKEFIDGKYTADIAALMEAINVVPEDLLKEYSNAARLNIIWTDRDERNDVVGIMEAVVNAKANNTVNNDAIYNLNGMRVKNAGKGIYIQNGKKIIK